MVRVVFCEQCGTILDEPTHSGTTVDCRLCGTTVSSKVFEDLVLHSAGSEHVVEGDPIEGASRQQQQRVRATVREACPKCKHPELQYYTMQLRSADEGQTVFYECAKCGHTFSTNT
mmetsp:Transcript_41731/g.110065  ORF Transcript_41731/g.110065 Transcript_41731/m.110065 type:complete len:116 (+) Transcript_41731:68-415(+)